MKLAIVTATTDPDRSLAIRSNWLARVGLPVDTYTIINGHPAFEGGWQVVGSMKLAQYGQTSHYYAPQILGVVPAFAIGVQRALEDGAEVIACLHDDCEIYEWNWGKRVLYHFGQHPRCGLLGFGGGRGLGAADIYQTPYNPMQLARQDFVSNMRDAEAHGRRVLTPMRVACLDGFSQVGRREFWMGLTYQTAIDQIDPYDDLFHLMQSWGVIHHFYDGMLGCFAARLGWETWLLPLACHHQGGVTAVGDPRYLEWATANCGITFPNSAQHPPTGDQTFWHRSHEIGYEQFKDVLPIRPVD